ncbi:MAG: hypothetical protein KBA97_08065 [Methanothrix sp.]|nr:hypothetical protein [Methanothrix sp.]
MTCNLCTRAQAAACVGEAFCASLHLTDDEACRLAAEACLSWWQKRDDTAETDDVLWEMSQNRIDELACDPKKARAYLAERIFEH